MPIAPLFQWEQSNIDVLITVEVKGVKKDAIDVFISDLFVKVNAGSAYLLQLDLLHPIVVEQSKFSIKEFKLKILLPKQTHADWEALCVDKKDLTPSAVAERRAGALKRAEELYNTKLDTREKQKEVERKRMLEEHWEYERQQRLLIEEKARAEKESEEKKLSEWEVEVKKPKETPKTPADIFSAAQRQNTGQPEIRSLTTTTVPISFTPKTNTMPTRSRNEEDYYRKSKFKPVRVEDSPVFWKEKADKLYKSRDWKGAAEAYSEAIKRDGSFLTCVSNRAAAYIQLADYAKAVADCDLALNMVAGIPASDTTQEQYRRTLLRLHIRRGAALCWGGEVEKGIEDYRLAVAYRDQETDQDIVSDLDRIVEYMKSHGLVEQHDPTSIRHSEAAQLYYKGNFAAAAEAYLAMLAANEFDVKARSNLAATYLHQGLFQMALEESLKLIDFCREVANALAEPGAQGSALDDSDDEDEAEDEMVARKIQASKTIQEKSGHVYLLLKSYIRAGAAFCGLGDYRKGYEMFEAALKITPYDDDLREDANRILEKLRMSTLVSASTGGGARPQQN